MGQFQTIFLSSDKFVDIFIRKSFFFCKYIKEYHTDSDLSICKKIIEKISIFTSEFDVKENLKDAKLIQDCYKLMKAESNYHNIAEHVEIDLNRVEKDKNTENHKNICGDTKFLDDFPQKFPKIKIEPQAGGNLSLYNFLFARFWSDKASLFSLNDKNLIINSADVKILRIPRTVTNISIKNSIFRYLSCKIPSTVDFLKFQNCLIKSRHFFGNSFFLSFSNCLFETGVSFHSDSILELTVMNCTNDLMIDSFLVSNCSYLTFYHFTKQISIQNSKISGILSKTSYEIHLSECVLDNLFVDLIEQTKPFNLIDSSGTVTIIFSSILYLENVRFLTKGTVKVCFFNQRTLINMKNCKLLRNQVDKFISSTEHVIKLENCVLQDENGELLHFK